MNDFRLFLGHHKAGIEVRYMEPADDEDRRKDCIAWFNDTSNLRKLPLVPKYLLLHREFAEGLNVNAPSGLVIMEPLTTAVRVDQLYARILRFCPWPIKNRKRPIRQLCGSYDYKLFSLLGRLVHHQASIFPYLRQGPWSTENLKGSFFMRTSAEEVLEETNLLRRNIETLQRSVLRAQSDTGRGQGGKDLPCVIWNNLREPGTCRNLPPFRA
jgi:hypothetical protein